MTPTLAPAGPTVATTSYIAIPDMARVPGRLDDLAAHLTRDLAVDQIGRGRTLTGPVKVTTEYTQTLWSYGPDAVDTATWHPLPDDRTIPAHADMVRVTVTSPTLPLTTSTPDLDAAARRVLDTARDARPWQGTSRAPITPANDPRFRAALDAYAHARAAHPGDR